MYNIHTFRKVATIIFLQDGHHLLTNHPGGRRLVVIL
ncbi:Uncharacterised protein [Salmonella enterica subsp. enterica serovar Bovismorbificans]|uniref:Uncharacterized protein n=1 Tax=Salmonella enterica subsp. enterica serovar Bovismorbificans TaxID=58097 RepID=A0A655BN79_SALET|nr:Uncharacterised protein [Salmonella enterica subsp. enterica serovar Bovismorbificans]